MTAPIDLSANHFELFGLQPNFALATDAIDRKYREIQTQVHPDRFASASDAERRLSMQWATRVNEAYGTLKSPLKRAAYLLELRGIDLGIENNTAMPADFLVAQMEWREALEEAEDEADISALDDLSARLRAEMRVYYAELEKRIDVERNYPLAGGTVRKLMFLDKLQSEIGDAIAGLED